jgi:asparagine synthase (glutamine-hydrolysing)
VHFSDRADAVAFASSSREISLQAVFDYVYFHVIPAPRTVFARVERVPPASRVHASRAGVRLESTWTPDYSAQQRFSFGAAASELDAALDASVEDCLRGSVRPGAFLSGGIDSSTLAGLLARHRSSPEAFSIGFHAPEYDETHYARIAARRFGLRHHVYYVTAADVDRSLVDVAAYYDQPFGNSSALPAFYCARLAASENVDRLLAGDGGDELFGGNARYAKQKVFDLYQRLPHHVRGTLERLLLDKAGAPRRLPGLSKLSSYVAQSIVPMPERMEIYNLLGRFGAEAVFPRSVLDVVESGEPAALQRSVYAESPATDIVDRMLMYDWRFTLSDNDLPKVVGTSALARMDVRFPFLADAVVDLSTAIPPAMKVRGLRLRYFYKEAFRSFLPREILLKRKHGFGLPFGMWLVSDARLLKQTEAALDALVARGLIRREFARGLLSERLGTHPGYFGEMAWILTCLEHWLAAYAPQTRIS